MSASRAKILFLLPLLGFLGFAPVCKNSIDQASCSRGCDDPYIPCLEQAIFYGRSPNGQSVEEREGGVLLLSLGCETDKAVCKANCGRAISAQ